jgi:hypothetical protein
LNPLPDDASREVTLQFSSGFAARVVFYACLAVEVLLVLLDYHVNFGRLTDSGALRRLTNIAREDGLASWFGTTQTLFVGLTAWVLWMSVRVSGATWWRRGGWFLVAAIFTYMAIDDAAQLHERLGAAYRGTGGAGSGIFPSFAWQIIFVPTLGTALLVSGAFLWKELQTRSARLLVAAAILMFAAAVVLDFFEGLDRDHSLNPFTFLAARYDLAAYTEARFGQSSFTTLVHFSRSIEEFLEMLANTCFWTALVSHLRTTMPDIRLRTTG